MGVRVLIVEDEPYMAEAVRDGLRPEAIAADIADDYLTKPFELRELVLRLRAPDRRRVHPFTNAARITVSALRERLGEPSIIATVPGVG
jgi:DNA-binding response OmpR family regulator